MLEKKLLTIGCALGILACGACFNGMEPGATPPPPPPPPPPLHIALHGVRSIRVLVTNHTETPAVAPGILARAIRDKIDSYGSSTGVYAHVQGDPGAGEAVLAVTILSESATPSSPPSPAGFVKLLFVIRESATLTAPDGRVLWSESNAEDTQLKWTPAGDPAFGWREPAIQQWAINGVAEKLVKEMFFGK